MRTSESTRYHTSILCWFFTMLDNMFCLSFYLAQWLNLSPLSCYLFSVFPLLFLPYFGLVSIFLWFHFMFSVVLTLCFVILIIAVGDKICIFNLSQSTFKTYYYTLSHSKRPWQKYISISSLSSQLYDLPHLRTISQRSLSIVGWCSVS